MTTEWVGTAANTDIPLPRNVRRYYIPSTTHGGGAGGFNPNPPATGVGCPGNNWGTGTFRANPVPETEITNVLRVAMRNWLMNGTLPPPSRYPTLTGGNLVAPTQAAMGFPSGVPGVPLGTYLGWNRTIAGFHAGQVCNYIGGMIPFARTQAERLASGDPRLSLEERYGTHDGYVAAVRKAADSAQSQGYLLPADHDALINAAAASTVLQ